MSVTLQDMQREGRPEFYVLDEDNVPMPATSQQWAAAQESPEKFLFRSPINDHVTVITAFLGFDHDYMLGERTEQLLFGTIVKDGSTYRNEALCATYDEATKAHKAAREREEAKAERANQ